MYKEVPAELTVQILFHHENHSLITSSGGWEGFDRRFHSENNQVSVGLEIRILMLLILIFLSDSDSHCLNLSSICSVHYE